MLGLSERLLKEAIKEWAKQTTQEFLALVKTFPARQFLKYMNIKSNTEILKTVKYANITAFFKKKN